MLESGAPIFAPHRANICVCGQQVDSSGVRLMRYALYDIKEFIGSESDLLYQQETS